MKRLTVKVRKTLSCDDSVYFQLWDEDKLLLTKFWPRVLVESALGVGIGDSWVEYYLGVH